MEQTKICPGNCTPSIPEVQSPEEFFQRSGIRGERDSKAEQEYKPSGSISVYPSTKQLFDNHRKYFLELISDYPDLVTYPFFSNPYISSDSLTSGFAISTLDSVNIEENEIVFKGKGFYFPNELNYN